MMEEEIWKDIPGYEGRYQASDLGRIRSLSRYFKNHSKMQYMEGRILRPNVTEDGYCLFSFYINSKKRVFSAHQLVAMAFLGHTPTGKKIVIDHIDHNPSNNKLSNLQILTTRQNTSKKAKKYSDNYTSKYTGVHKIKYKGMFTAALRIKGTIVNLGSYKCDKEASEHYQEALKHLEKFNGNRVKYKNMIKEIIKNRKTKC